MLHNIALILLMLLDLFAGYWLLTGSGMLRFGAIGLHGVSVLIAMFIFKQIRTSNLQVGNNFLYIGFALSLVLPVYGLAGMYLIYLVASRSRFIPVDYFDITDDVIPERYELLMHDVPRLDAAVITREELEIESYRDVLRANDRQLEENTINKLSKILTRDSVSILREVVKHAISDTKVLAATALIDMEDKVIERIEHIRTRLAQKPDDEDAILDLAHAYDLYCYLGVLDEVIENHYRLLAVEQYRTFLICRPRHPQATMEYGRVLLNAGKLERAVKVLKDATQLDTGNPKPYFWLAEAYFETGDFEEVITICKRIHTYQNLPDEFTPVTGLWAEEEEWLLN